MGYCLLPNHYLIVVPSSEEALARAIGEAHRRYTRQINFREKWRGYLWQGRFASFVMDEPYLLAAVRYVELNPVRAGLVLDAADWRWSSAKAPLSGRDDALVQVAPLLALVSDWRGFLYSAMPEEELRDLRDTEATEKRGRRRQAAALPRRGGRVPADQSRNWKVWTRNRQMRVPSGIHRV